MRSVFSVAVLTFATACASATYDTHDDLTISTQVKIALIDDARLAELRINAATTHGVVTLQGSVPSQADADHAVAVARKVKGVRGVRSELKIELSASGFRLPASSSSGFSRLIACG